DAERSLIELARTARDDADALDRQRTPARMIRKQPLDARAEWRQRAGQHAGIGTAQELVQREQRRKLFAREPESRQLEALGLVGRIADRGFLALAALDRRAERVAQERDIAIQRRARAAELVLEMLQCDRIT